MTQRLFRTADGHGVTAVTASEMRAVDRVAVEEVGLKLLQMMENAGRVFARHVRDVRGEEDDVLVVAGNGGNGGGGMACARHLGNRDVPVQVFLDRPADQLTGAAAHQWGILKQMDIPIHTAAEQLSRVEVPTVVVDSLIGYGLSGDVRPPASNYIDWMNHRSAPVVSLDVPSGRDATTGDAHGVAIRPDRTLTLALPKTGLESVSGTLFLADIGIPKTVYERLDIQYETPFGDRDLVELTQ